MRNNPFKFLAHGLFAALFFSFLPAISMAEGDKPEAMTSEAKVISMIGTAEVMPSGETEWKLLAENALLHEGDKMRTGKDSKALVETQGNKKTATLTVRKETEFSFKVFHHDEAAKTENTVLDLESGSLLIEAEKIAPDSHFQVKTPTSVVDAHEAKFEVNVSK